LCFNSSLKSKHVAAVAIAGSVGFATLGVILVTNGKEDEGTRYGRLALSILNKFQARDLECRVHTIVYGMIHPSSHAMRDSIKPLLAAHRTGLVTGDIQVRDCCGV
jgi:predicted ATPase